MENHDIIDCVRQTIAVHNMISHGDTVITGLSGGADSVSLLLCLNALSGELGFTLRALHVNHLMRGEEAYRDESFCVSLCSQLDIPIDVRRVNVYSFAASSGRSDEDAARVLRYRELSKAAEQYSQCKIATAHNLCDSAETMIFNIVRGTSGRGLRGIPYVRGNIIRPLLDIKRTDIEAFLADAGQHYVTDSTNLCDCCSRNVLRHKVIPILRSINSGFYQNVQRLMLSASEDEDFFDDMLKNIPEENMFRQHPALRKRYIRNILEQHGISCSYRRISELDELLCSKKNTKISLGKNIYAVLNKGVLSVEHICEDSDMFLEKIIQIKSETVIPIPEFDKIVTISRFYDDIDIKSGIIHKKSTNSCFNCDKINGVVKIRLRKGSDSVVLKGRSFHTRLKKLDSSFGLTESERCRTLVIEDDSGIIWAEYAGVSNSAAARDSDSPEKIYEIKVVPSDDLQ